MRSRSTSPTGGRRPRRRASRNHRRGEAFIAGASAAGLQAPIQAGTEARTGSPSAPRRRGHVAVRQPRRLRLSGVACRALHFVELSRASNASTAISLYGSRIYIASTEQEPGSLVMQITRLTQNSISSTTLARCVLSSMVQPNGYTCDLAVPHPGSVSVRAGWQKQSHLGSTTPTPRASTRSGPRKMACAGSRWNSCRSTRSRSTSRVGGRRHAGEPGESDAEKRSSETLLPWPASGTQPKPRTDRVPQREPPHLFGQAVCARVGERPRVIWLDTALAAATRRLWGGYWASSRSASAHARARTPGSSAGMLERRHSFP
jgi:hypothetical protein